MTPLVAIPCRMLPSVEKEWADISGVRLSYIESIQQAGGCPFLIPISDDLPNVRRLYNIADCVLLAGGEDVEPHLYGETSDSSLTVRDQSRDALEYSIARWCFQEQKPMFGICRGLQIMNIALGGSLYQDIPTEFNVNHDYAVSGNPTATMAPAHKLLLDDTSLLAKLFGTNEVSVNSVHHQSVKRVAPGLQAVGYAEDGIIEALEGDTTEHPFLVGVQCHPETLWKEHDARWLKVFSEFITAGREFRKAQGLKSSQPRWIAGIATS
jgi:putative glutamine amidotransferase